ncbi:MAG TPA: Fe-S cluster assembly ATPase SufC [Acholeplasma sp.]|jgi:Fe-S cluster assembly ATP-binding protein|nr:Fe-S cluster assembly ATPase SufC [Acholeplasma sp.]
MKVLEIKDLHVSVENKEILKGVNLTLKTGEFHAIMGPNGAGKSTLAAAIMGHYNYQVTQGSITLNGEDVLKMSVDERARKGLFLGMQYPSEVSGLTNAEFIKKALEARLEEGERLSLFKFIKELDQTVKELQMKEDLPERYLNEGFSGGEKKRNEILQMKLLKPNIALLDEIDSGLDVDGLKVVGEAINKMKGPDFGAMLITHYERLLDYLDIDQVHVLVDGRIVKSGGAELIKKINKEGYDWVRIELGIFEEEEKPISLESCAVKESAARPKK